ncbi:MAG: hypothetical protein Q7V57_17405 [Actinomycetota bacterium]|nr:hypothetical protein [Actinomycetota bacterium]
MNTTASLPFRLARWFEARLHQTIDFNHSSLRLYGFEVVDPEGFDHDHPGAARVTFIAEGADIDALARHPDAPRVRDFDAIAIVSAEWRIVPPPDPRRPRQYPVRRKARVVEVRDNSGGAVVMRFEHEPNHVVFTSAA